MEDFLLIAFLIVSFLSYYPWQNFISRDQGTRLNIFSEELKNNLSTLQEPNNKTFSWVVMVGAKEQKANSNPILKHIDIHELLDSKTKEELINFWKNDYIDSIISEYPNQFKVKQLDSLKERLEKGHHFVFKNNGLIVGHGCYTEVKHPVLGIECLYWHQWVNQDAPSVVRREVHQAFFYELYSKKKMLMSGVAIANKKSLDHCIRNGFEPILLSIRKLG